jgi:cardiolipin synthase
MDEKRVLAGGANIASEYMGPEPKAGRWKDLMFTLEGPAVLRYAEIFRSDWEFASGESLDLGPAEADAFGARNGALVQVIPSGPDVQGDPLYGAILTAIYAAKTRLWIVTPYFVPDEAMTQALTLAVHRGIDLRIIVPKASNHPMADLARGTYLREIQEAGGKILLFEDGMVHAKAMVMDDELAMIGSVNMDLRSLFLDYEVVVFIYSEPEIQEVAHWMERLQERSRSGVKKVGTLRDIGEGVVRMMAPLL